MAGAKFSAGASRRPSIQRRAIDQPLRQTSNAAMWRGLVANGAGTLFPICARTLELQKRAAAAWLRPMPAKTILSPDQSSETPHYHGHRERLRERFYTAGPEALSDYELLEMALFPALL